MISCTRAINNLSRFLDGDLDGRAATAVAEHLAVCPACRGAREREQALRAALRGLPVPPGGDAARERVFSRLHRAVRTGEARSRRALWIWRPVAWRPAAATLAAAALAALVFLLGPAPISPPSGPALDVPLPGPAEMSTLYHLHDAHGGAVLAPDEPILHRDVAAEARAALLRDADDAVAGSL